MEKIEFECTPDFRKYLDSLTPEMRAKQIAHLNRHERIFKKINREFEEGIKSTFNGNEYDPELTYYFVDYFSEVETRWVRNSLCTFEDVQEIVESLEEGEFKNLRIQTEEYLSALHENVLAFDDHDVVESEITERTFQFGNFYDSHYEDITGEESLGRKSGESKSEWVARVKKAKVQEEN